MAIRQLLFNVGDELGITEKGTRLIESEVMENLDANLENGELLIVKCGKSFWDVTKHPEIFEASDEFKVEDLTGIDRKQMSKTEKPAPAYRDRDENPLSMLFHRTDAEIEEEETEQLERKTYYLRSKDVEAITIVQHETRVQVSAIVREALERGLKSIAEEIGYNGDLYEQAEKNLAEKGFTGKKKSFKGIRK